MRPMRALEPEGPHGEPDPLARLLEWGLAASVVLFPLPFGSVVPGGRLALELIAFALALVWVVRAFRHPTPVPPVAVRAGLTSLLVLALVQAAPLGALMVGLVSPRAIELRQESRPAGDALAAERELLGVDPTLLDAPATVSLDPGATASALRTGAALSALLLVATTVAATRGVRLLVLGLLLSAAFQGLYGILVLASGHDQIWHLPKRYYLDCATGTFVNRNHFAGFLAATLPAGLARSIAQYRGSGQRHPARKFLLELFSPEASKTILLGLLVITGLAGLLLSFSRAGIVLGMAALLLTVVATGRRGLGTRLVIVLLVLGVAAVPLSQIGCDRLASRYASASEDLVASGGRAAVWKDTLSMAAAFPVTGVGFGTFASAYPLYRSPSVRLFYAHAHNDLIQYVAEGGIVGGLLLLLLLGPVLLRIVRGLAGHGDTLAAGLAAGLAALLLHGLVDFNFHIPSNAATAAILAGALLGLPWSARSVKS